MFEAQMRDLMDCSDDFALMLGSKLDHTYSMLDGYYQQQLFSHDSAVSKVKSPQKAPPASPARSSWPLAKVLPVTKRAPELFFKPENVSKMNSPTDVGAFFSLIYTSMEAPAELQ
eukprot:TRINITY_DN5834_c0_g1_i6.p2 TRINITY_DN5834_c0_g1~~TRINITY_DN5834_c0_g1_i6.p2  ORF type:complete len:115 (+),score=28.51 TRINITY_DN5834_c0_g1_i6:716-1060(+)